MLLDSPKKAAAVLFIVFNFRGEYTLLDFQFSPYFFKCFLVSTFLFIALYGQPALNR
jgi:hypothetical protein